MGLERGAGARDAESNSEIAIGGPEREVSARSDTKCLDPTGDVIGAGAPRKPATHGPCQAPAQQQP